MRIAAATVVALALVAGAVVLGATRWPDATDEEGLHGWTTCGPTDAALGCFHPGWAGPVIFSGAGLFASAVAFFVVGMTASASREAWEDSASTTGGSAGARAARPAGRRRGRRGRRRW